MRKKIYNLCLVLVLGLGLALTNSCEKEKIYPPDSDTVNEFYTLMNQWYYWKDSIADVNPDNYLDPDDLLEAMRFTPRDKWSYITTQEEHSQFYEEGTYVGYGFGYAPDFYGNIRITFLYDDSELKELGIERGWIIKEINGSSINKNSDLNNLLSADLNSINFESPLGIIKSGEFEKKLITMNTVGYKSIIEKGDRKVGYFVFKSFIGPSIDELTEIVTNFKNENVNELVIDLRYNGGGRLDVVSHLAGLIIPDNINGELFFKYVHNNDRSDNNESEYFVQDQNSLCLNKVYFIAGKGSASASEVIINSLDPHIDVYIVGDDTYGKPVGMYSFNSNISNLVYVPITFKLLNSLDYGGYYDGLKADCYVEDDILHNFGIGEAVFDEVLFHIENDRFSSTKSSGEIFRAPVKEIRSIKDERGSL